MERTGKTNSNPSVIVASLSSFQGLVSTLSPLVVGIERGERLGRKTLTTIPFELKSNLLAEL